MTNHSEQLKAAGEVYESMSGLILKIEQYTTLIKLSNFGNKGSLSQKWNGMEFRCKFQLIRALVISLLAISDFLIMYSLAMRQQRVWPALIILFILLILSYYCWLFFYERTRLIKRLDPTKVQSKAQELINLCQEFNTHLRYEAKRLTHGVDQINPNDFRASYDTMHHLRFDISAEIHSFLFSWETANEYQRTQPH